MNKIKWLTDEEYAYIYDRAPRLCVDLVIKEKGGVLLSLRQIEPYKGEWSLPGGIMYKEETVEEAAIRIAKKETGLDISVGRLLGYMEFFNEVMGNHERHSVSLALECEVLGGELKADFQSSRIAYHSSMPEGTILNHKKFLEEKDIL